MGIGEIENMPSVKNNYDSANAFVKSVEQAVKKTSSTVIDNKSDSLFNVSSGLLQKNTTISKRYEVSGDAAIKKILEDGAHVKYVEKHYGEGSGKGKRVLNPVTEIHFGIFLEMKFRHRE